MGLIKTRQPLAGDKLQATGCRLQAAGSKLQAIPSNLSLERSSFSAMELYEGVNAAGGVTGGFATKPDHPNQPKWYDDEDAVTNNSVTCNQKPESPLQSAFPVSKFHYI